MTRIKGFIDADAHVVESDQTILEFLPPPYRGRDDLLAFPFFPTLDGFYRQALRVVDGKGRYVAAATLKEWQDFLDEDQIEWSVLYPTAGLTFGLIRDKSWACALAQGYNNYLSEVFLKARTTVERYGAHPASIDTRGSQGTAARCSRIE